MRVTCLVQDQNTCQFIGGLVSVCSGDQCTNQISRSLYRCMTRVAIQPCKLLELFRFKVGATTKFCMFFQVLISGELLHSS